MLVSVVRTLTSLCLLVGLAVLGGGIGIGEAVAQSCSADSQCALPGLNRRFSCQGSVLVATERRCLGGRCTTSSERRIDCGGGVGLGNCDPVSGSCRSRPGEGRQGPALSAATSCPPRCLCRDRRLIVVTGKPGIAPKRCDTIETACSHGCSCLPQARCLAEGEAAPRRTPATEPTTRPVPPKATTDKAAAAKIARTKAKKPKPAKAKGRRAHGWRG